MTANERRMEIIRILTIRRSETAPRLAREFGVCVNTIRRDILMLTHDYPLESQPGKGGCIRLPNWYHPHKHVLSQRHQEVLIEAKSFLEEEKAQIIQEILDEYGSPSLKNSH